MGYPDWIILQQGCIRSIQVGEIFHTFSRFGIVWNNFVSEILEVGDVHGGRNSDICRSKKHVSQPWRNIGSIRFKQWNPSLKHEITDGHSVPYPSGFRKKDIRIPPTLNSTSKPFRLCRDLLLETDQGQIRGNFCCNCNDIEGCSYL